MTFPGIRTVPMNFAVCGETVVKLVDVAMNVVLLAADWVPPKRLRLAESTWDPPKRSANGIAVGDCWIAKNNCKKGYNFSSTHRQQLKKHKGAYY